MSTKLVLLGLLKEKPLHGYELKQIIEKNMGDWTNIAFGSIYFALSKLTEEGLVANIGEEKIGNRPSRNIYKITDKGKKEFLSLIKEIWKKIDREYYPLDIALAFSYEIPKAELIDYINQRIIYYEKRVKFLDAHKKEGLKNEYMPKIAGTVFSHTEYHLKAELNWLKDLLKDIESGKLI